MSIFVKTLPGKTITLVVENERDVQIGPLRQNGTFTIHVISSNITIDNAVHYAYN